MTESKSIFILCLAILIVIFSGCSKQENDSMSELQTSTTVVDDGESTAEKTESETATEIKSNSESTTVKSESTTRKNEDSDTTTKPAEQKSAGQTTTKKQSETNAKKDYIQTTASQNAETTKAVMTTKKETTTQNPVTTTEKSFDVSYWVSYAKEYARSVGLEVNSSASDCWDNPISANSKCKYLERDIKGRLNRYAKDEDITQIWVWAEKTSADSYNIYIGYA